MLNRLRLFSGLTLFVFVTGHFFNHMLGLISLDVMNRASSIFITPWQSLPGTILIAGSFLLHAGIALWSLWQKRTLRMPVSSLLQLTLGLLAPLLLAAHVTGTRGLGEISDFDANYASTLNVLWVVAPWRGILQGVALVVIWTHSCIGLNTWLRTKPGYLRFQPLAFALAISIPTLALAGYISAGTEVRELARDPEWIKAVGAEVNYQSWMPSFVFEAETVIQISVIALIVAVLLLRLLRIRIRAWRNIPKVYYSPNNRIAELTPEATLLESIRAASIPHASVCDGKGRCSTCRVRIGRGLENLAEASEDERKVLARVTRSPSVRLACQIRPTSDIEVTALVRADAAPAEAIKRPGYRQGREMNAAFLFVDLRGSTKLCEERLPFDVVFVLNQFFAELSLALRETSGHYAQFNGDGLMAIYGLESGPEAGCGEAIKGAVAMARRISELNDRLRDELGHDLEIGIGIHSGEAIIGSMGPPQSPIVSAIGDTVNIAARLESQTKELGAQLVISASTAEKANQDLSAFPRHTVQVKGRDQALDVYAVDHLTKIPEAPRTIPEK